MEGLPDELLIEQLLLLPTDDIFSACQTNQQFAQVCRRPDLWIRLSRRDFPLARFNRENNPKETYLAAVMIRRRFPEVDLIDVRDPVAFYNYCLGSSNFILRVWRLFNLPWRIEMITRGLTTIGWDTVYGFNPYLNLEFGIPPINFPNIFLEPVIGEVLLNMFQRQHQEIYQAVIEIVLKEAARRERKKIRDKTLAEPLQNGQYVFQYYLPDGSLHGIDLTRRYLQEPYGRKYLADEVLREFEILEDAPDDLIQIDSPEEMSDQEIHYAAQNGEYRLRYQHPDGRLHSIEVPRFYKPLIDSRNRLVEDLLRFRSPI